VSPFGLEIMQDSYCEPVWVGGRQDIYFELFWAGDSAG